MKDQQIAKEAATQKLLQSILPEIERQIAKKSNARGKGYISDVSKIFENILSNGGIDGRDSFKSRHECLQFIQKMDNEQYVYVLEKQGAIRDLDILDRGGDDDQGMTCLMWAVFFNWEQVARILIDLGANGQLTMNCDRTHLMVAAWRGSTSLVEFIVEMYPSQLGLEDVNKDTALVTSLTHNRHDVVKTLIACNDREEEKGGEFGLDYDTALLKAIDMGSDRNESSIQLVPKVKNVNNGPRKTPYLYKAAIAGNLELSEALIKEGAQVDKMKRSSGTNALMEAARQGHVDIVRLLLQHKADPNLISDFEEDNDTGYTALHFAARFNNYQCIQLLIDHGADIQKESENRNYTPYVIAIRFKALEAQKLLATGKCELPILLEALNSKNMDSVDHLLTSCEHSTDQVNAALVECCKRGYSDIAKLLLRKFCADANSTIRESKKKNSRELSCALLASMRGHLTIVEALLNHDANFLLEDENGATAIHYVMACNASSDLIEQLMNKYGISAFTKKDKNGRRAIYYANKEETLRNLFKLDEDEFKPKWINQKDLDEGEQVEERNLRITSDTFPEAVIKFESLSKDILDRTIQPVGYGPHDQNLEVKVDFSFFYKQGDLVTSNHLHEDVLESLLQNDSPAIHHPAIKMFLLKKYNGFPRLYARLQFWLYFLLTIAFTSGTIISVASDNGNSQKTAERLVGTGCSFAALILTVLAIAFELLRLDEKGFKYFAIASSWFRFFTYLGALIATVCQLFVEFGDDRKVLQSLLRALQSFEVLGLFFNMLLTLRRSAVYGIYVSIFCNVLENVVKLTVLIGLMILAFSASFYCIFQNEGQYNGMGNTGFKVVSMMMGSVEPEEVLASPSDWTLFFAQSALFVIFLIFMAIITMNLLIGLAISDVAAEIPLAKQTHLSQLTDHIVQSENIARALPCFSRFCFKDKEAVIEINQYDTSRGIVGTIASCFAPKSTPQFEQELIEEIKTIVQEIFVLNTTQKCY